MCGDSGTYILTTADEIQVLLDDHIVKTQTMKNSPYIKPFESTIQYVNVLFIHVIWYARSAAGKVVTTDLLRISYSALGSKN